MDRVARSDPMDSMSEVTETIFNWQIDTPVHQAIGEAIGAASMCWENPSGAGVFNPERAIRIADELEALLRRKLWVQE